MPPTTPTTVLVTGVGMAKGLALARALHLSGHRVIGADFEPSDIHVSGRYSRALARFYRLSFPNPSFTSINVSDTPAPYVQELLDVVRIENVSLWISCSAVGSATDDGLAKILIETQTHCRAVQFSAERIHTLHQKDCFAAHMQQLGLSVPETHRITDAAMAMTILQAARAEAKVYIMKNIALDDASRGNLTLLPRPTKIETERHLAQLHISEDRPWVLQQYIASQEEYCTHALVVRGQVRAFVACPSSELLMHYKALEPDHPLSEAMLDFTRRYLHLTRATGRDDGDSEDMSDLNGHLSFDFLAAPPDTAVGGEKVLNAIECNPRAHTAVVLFGGVSPQIIATPYLEAVSDHIQIEDSQECPKRNNQPVIVYPPPRPQSYYWIGHDLVALVVIPILQCVTLTLHVSGLLQSLRTFLVHVLFWKEGTWEWWDPLPAWWLYHVYWPSQFVVAITKQRWWSRVNVSTTKIFRC